MPLIGSGLIQAAGPSFGTVAADSSDSALLAGQDALVCVYDGAAYIYFGKASGVWKTLWVDTTGGLLRGDEAGTYAVTLASDGPAPFDAAYGFATDRKAGGVSAGTTFTHTADALIRYTMTTVGASDTFVFFRQQDASNYWRIYVNSIGTIGLHEFVSGSGTARGTSSSAVSNGTIVSAVFTDETITIFTDTTSKIAYASAANFKAETAGRVSLVAAGGVLSDLSLWPRSGATVASILDKVSA